MDAASSGYRPDIGSPESSNAAAAHDSAGPSTSSGFFNRPYTGSSDSVTAAAAAIYYDGPSTSNGIHGNYRPYNGSSDSAFYYDGPSTSSGSRGNNRPYNGSSDSAFYYDGPSTTSGSRGNNRPYNGSSDSAFYYDGPSTSSGSRGYNRPYNGSSNSVLYYDGPGPRTSGYRPYAGSSDLMIAESARYSDSPSTRKSNSREKKKNNSLGDEECINFRPSPNFKHMRKYLKSKFEESNSPPNQSSDPSTTPNSEEQENIKPLATMAQRVQPPLPPNSPPPDSPLVVPKEEIVDEEYEGDTPRPELLLAEYKEEQSDQRPPERTMCRQFARGMCTRGASCIFAHELILSQLPGVYTFCKNFQNTVCNFPKCKFVHASVFEKEHFYRTGYLPPHTLAHLKESNSALGPPSVLEGTPAEASQVVSNPPPAMHPGVSTLPTSGCAPGCPPEIVAKPELFASSPLKREWADTDLAAAHDHDCNEPKKKCNHCDVNEIRLQCLKTKLDKLRETHEAYAVKELQLQNWEDSLNNVLSMLLPKSRMSPTPPSLLTAGKSKENAMLEQINLFFQLNSRKNEVDASSKIMSQLVKLLKEERWRLDSSTGKPFDAL